jgi:hypothetical protein
MASSRNRQMLLQSRTARSGNLPHPDQFYSRDTAHTSSKKVRTNSTVGRSSLGPSIRPVLIMPTESGRPPYKEEQYYRNESAQKEDVSW